MSLRKSVKVELLLFPIVFRLISCNTKQIEQSKGSPDCLEKTVFNSEYLKVDTVLFKFENSDRTCKCCKAGVKLWRLMIIFLIIFTTSCYKNGQLGTSRDIQDSKKKGVFIQEYSVSENPYLINDTIKLTVKDVWLEKKWRYSGKNHAEIIPFDEFQLRINTDEDDLEGFPFKWSIGHTTDLYMRPSGKSGLIGDFKAIPPDHLVYPIQAGESFAGDSVIIIGELILFRK